MIEIWRVEHRTDVDNYNLADGVLAGWVELDFDPTERIEQLNDQIAALHLELRGPDV